MHTLPLALLLLAPAPKAGEPALTLVTMTNGGRQVRFADSLGTTMQGGAVALLGSSHVVSDGTEADWDGARKQEHVRVRFARPVALRARAEDGEKTYVVAEILITLSDTRAIRCLQVKAGGKYYKFAKFDGRLAIAVEQLLP